MSLIHLDFILQARVWQAVIWPRLFSVNTFVVAQVCSIIYTLPMAVLSHNGRVESSSRDHTALKA